MKKFNIYTFIWDFTELWYKHTRTRIQAPIEFFYPDFCPWLFGKMIGVKGKKVVEKPKLEIVK